MLTKYIQAAVSIMALFILIAPDAAFSKQGEEINSRGSLPADIFDRVSVMEFGVVKDISTVEFVGTSLMHHFHGVSHEARGFTRLSFTSPENASSEVTIPVNSLTGFALGSEKSDLTKNIHMNLESDKFPDMNLKIKQVLPENSGTGPGKRRFLVKGNLTIHNVTRPVIFTADMDVKDGYLHITGEYDSLNMRDFGVKPKPLMAFIKVDDLVDVKFNIYEELKGDATLK
jgi:polyisoprenoid-binding protein YceI